MDSRTNEDKIEYCCNCAFSVYNTYIKGFHCKKSRNLDIYSGTHECHIKGGFEFDENILDGSTVLSKPPLGVKPCYIQAEQRIKDLADAISRYANRGDYEIIKRWANEILMQCDIAEM